MKIGYVMMISLDTLWQEFLSIIKEEAGTRVVDTWFKAVSLIRWDPTGSAAYLEVPNIFIRDWIQSHYMPLIGTHLARLLHVQEIHALLVVRGAQAAQESKEIVHEIVVKQEEVAIVSEPKHQTQVAKAPTHRIQPGIRATHTFQTFVVGPNNSLAYAAAQAVTQKPGVLYNPLFIYGGSGLGKTHLLHAIGNGIKQADEKASILYQTADRFVNEFINAIRFDRVHVFKEKYRAVDVLLIDDIQFISNKEQTQEAFFHIFNTLYDLHKQIVFTSDVIPQNIVGLAERLRSRLSWGLVSDIQAPSLETKIAIVRKKAEQSHESFPDEVASFIASMDVSNIRELEGLLIRVLAFASLTGQPITLGLAQNVLGIQNPTPKSQSIDFEAIIRCLCRHFAYTLDDLRSKNRSKELSFVRHVAMFLMKKFTERSLRDIGVFLGGRDHSTVMHALEKIEESIKTDSIIREQIEKIEASILKASR